MQLREVQRTYAMGNGGPLITVVHTMADDGSIMSRELVIGPDCAPAIRFNNEELNEFLYALRGPQP